MYIKLIIGGGDQNLLMGTKWNVNSSREKKKGQGKRQQERYYSCNGEGVSATRDHEKFNVGCKHILPMPSTKY